MSPLEEIGAHTGRRQGIRLFLKRDDLLHPEIPGNKWRKIAPLLGAFDGSGYEGIVSFGGPFSNHLFALAAAGRIHSIPTAAVVRGQAARTERSPTLEYATACGMQWHAVSKSAYDAGTEHPEVQAVLARYPGYFVLPEGGSTPEGVRNCRNIAVEILEQAPATEAGRLFVAIGAGTGGTAAGLISGLGEKGRVLVFPAPAHGFSEQTVRRHFSEQVPEAPFTLIKGFDFGAFATDAPELIGFIHFFKHDTGVLLDPLYTGKMMNGVYDLMATGFFPENAVMVAVHTGGLQAWEGFEQRFGIQLP